MPMFSKTVYIEVEAADEDQANDRCSDIATKLEVEYPYITDVDIAGPMEEVR
jgi:hypothetical protein